MNEKNSRHLRLDLRRIRDFGLGRSLDAQSDQAARDAALRVERPTLVNRLMPISPRRRGLALLCLFFALTSWFVIPSHADSFGGGVTEPYKTWVHMARLDGTHLPDEPAGIFIMKDLSTGAGGIAAYCIDIAQYLDYNTTFSDGSQTSNQISYILNTYRFGQSDPGALVDPNLEAAAIQIAIWRYSDNAWPVGSANQLMMQRATAIFNDTQAHANAPQPNVISVSFPGGAPIYPTQKTTAGLVTVTHPDGSAAANQEVSLTASGGAFDPAGTTTASGMTDVNGHAAFTVYVNAPGTVNVTATSSTVVPAGRTLNPTHVNSQQLVIASQIPLSAQGAGSVTFTGIPQINLAKSVTDTISGVRGTNVAAKTGDQVTFDVSYANTGGAASAAATISDDLTGTAANNLGLLTNIANISNGGVLNGRVITWSVGALAPGAKGDVTFTATEPAALDVATLAICNTATANTGGGSNGGGPTSSNQACTTVSATASVVSAKLVDGVTSNVATLGETLRYSLTVKNNGTENLSGVTVRDVLKGNNLDLLGSVTPLAVGVTQDGHTATAAGGYDAATRTVSWTLASLPVGQTATVLFTASVPSTGLTHGVATCFTNMASVGGGGVNGQTNQVTTCVTPAVCVQPRPTLSLSGPNAYVAGTQQTWTASVGNSATTAMGPTSLTLTFPAGWTIVGSTPAASTKPGSATFSLGTLAGGASTTATLTLVPNTTSAAGATVLSGTATGGDSSGIPDCPPSNVSINAQSSGTLEYPSGGPPQSGVLAATTPIVAPATGAGPGLIHNAVFGLFLALAGIIVVTGLRRKTYEY